jgi:hypothetical protein
MIRIIIYILFFCISGNMYSQTSTSPSVPKTKVEYRNSDAVYNLYPTENYYNFIKLNTRNGTMWQVQYSMDDEKRFTTVLNDISLVLSSEESNQRFMLMPTTNMFTFILMDQIDGRTWQVQWNVDPLKRMVLKIR